MSSGEKIRVMLAGPYPHPGGMAGTYGRILDNIRNSTVFRDAVEFIPHRVTLPADGSFPRRWLIDMVSGARSLAQRPDVLHYIMQKYRAAYREFPVLTAARAIGIRTAVDIRAGALQWMLRRKNHRLQNAIMRNLLRRSDAVIMECPKDVAFLREQFGREALYLPNIVPEEEFRRIRPVLEPPREQRPIRLIHSGRYLFDKGTGVVLEALQLLSQRGIETELHLTGQGDDPELLEMIHKSVESPPRGTAVVDHGWDVPDLYSLLASADVFVMPSHWFGEGHPNAVSEAMMAGLAMVLTDWMHREDVVPRSGAIIVPPRDPVAVADAVERYATDPELLTRARRTNRRRVGERYLDSICYPELLRLYQRLCASPPA
jgi:glycosyltransferase involved in cell wall biosynthesis